MTSIFYIKQMQNKGLKFDFLFKTIVNQKSKNQARKLKTAMSVKLSCTREISTNPAFS